MNTTDAVQLLKTLRDYCDYMVVHGYDSHLWAKDSEALDAAIEALSIHLNKLPCDGCYWETHGSICHCMTCVRQKKDNYRPSEQEGVSK